MPDPSYEDQAKAKLAEVTDDHAMHDYEEQANLIAHAQVLATLEVAERLWQLEMRVGRS